MKARIHAVWLALITFCSTSEGAARIISVICVVMLSWQVVASVAMLQSCGFFRINCWVRLFMLSFNLLALDMAILYCLCVVLNGV